MIYGNKSDLGNLPPAAIITDTAGLKKSPDIESLTSYNDFYDFKLLRVSSIVIAFFYLLFQAKNYLSYIVKLEVKEVMYFILYLCTFKLAPWIWFYSFIF